MSYQDPIWGSLISALEVECDSFQKNLSNKGNTTKNSTSIPCAIKAWTDQYGVKNFPAYTPPSSSFPTHRAATKTAAALCDNFQANSTAPAENVTLPMKEWIKHALVNTALTSRAYLSACISIAIPLVEQMIQAQKLSRYGLSDKLDMLSISMAHRWSEFVMIRLKGQQSSPSKLADNDGRESKANQSEDLLPFSITGTADDTNNGEDRAQDMNADLELFLKSFETTNKTTQSTRPETSAALSLASGSIDDSSVCNADCNYLNVDVAEIKCPETGQNNCSVVDDRDEFQRIYYIGLVLYELFSGGQVPHPDLYALASSEGAFISMSTFTLVKTDTAEEEMKPSEVKKHCQGPENERQISLCKLSFEQLKRMGLPGPICHVIFNMMGGIYGDLRGDECYTDLVDVIFDLQLMKSRPDKFLRDLDINKLVLSGLQLDDNIIPRQNELELLKDCYRRRVMGSSRLAIIQGESGSGKSCLAKRLGEFVVEEKGIFITGKFDQMKQMKPFSALASAFDQYCEILVREKNSPWAMQIVDQIHAALGQDARHLAKLIPKLGLVLGNFSFMTNFNLDQNCVHTRQRLHYLLAQFVEVISINSNSITIFIDDVQWADEASISMMEMLLRREYKNIFFLWSYWDDMDHNHPIWQLIQNIHAVGLNPTIVTLKRMEEEELTTVMSCVLCLPPRLVRSLSGVLFKKTKGNPLFLSQLLLLLNRNRLIRLDVYSQRWVWDEDKIHSMKLPDNIAICFTNGINKLTFEVQLALKTLSIFGASTNIAYLTEIEKQLDLNLIGPLKEAAAEGLVSHIKGMVQFNHDRIQEVAYGMMEEQVRRHNHLRFGDCLATLSQITGDVDMMFTGVHQINLGGPSAILDNQESITMVNYNIIAGKKAMEMSGFASAFHFFQCAIKFLPPNHWTGHYCLSLELHELASKAALVSGNNRSFNNLSEEVLQHATCFEDKLNINYIIMSSLVLTPKILKALEMGRAILKRLGETIPTNPSDENLDEHIKCTQAMIKGMSEENLLNHKMMTDTISLRKMKFLAKTASIAVLMKPDLHPFITLKMVQLTIIHGLSPMSPIVFVCFGSFLAKASNLQVGYKFALLAKKLVDKLKTTEIAGEVILAVTELQCFVEPILATNELRAQGEHASILAGDVHFSCTSRLHYCLILLWAGLDLNGVSESIAKACQYMKDQGEDNNFIVTTITHRTVLLLLGKESEAPTEKTLSNIIHRNGNRPRQQIILSFNNLYLAFLLNNKSTILKSHAKKFIERKKDTSYVLFSDTIHKFILGLAAFQICRDSEPIESLQWLNVGRKCLSDMKLWAEQGSPWNFQQKYTLLRAEELYCSCNMAAAKQTYINAIALDRSHKVINDEALASELAAKFFYDTGDMQSSIEYFRLAHEKYGEWGACKRQVFYFSLYQRWVTVLGGCLTAILLQRRNKI